MGWGHIKLIASQAFESLLVVLTACWTAGPCGDNVFTTWLKTSSRASKLVQNFDPATHTSELASLRENLPKYHWCNWTLVQQDFLSPPPFGRSSSLTSRGARCFFPPWKHSPPKTTKILKTFFFAFYHWLTWTSSNLPPTTLSSASKKWTLMLVLKTTFFFFLASRACSQHYK